MRRPLRPRAFAPACRPDRNRSTRNRTRNRRYGRSFGRLFGRARLAKRTAGFRVISPRASVDPPRGGYHAENCRLRRRSHAAAGSRTVRSGAGARISLVRPLRLDDHAIAALSASSNALPPFPGIGGRCEQNPRYVPQQQRKKALAKASRIDLRVATWPGRIGQFLDNEAVGRAAAPSASAAGPGIRASCAGSGSAYSPAASQA